MSKNCSGEGSVGQRKDGRWYASLMVGGIRKTVYARSERQVRRKLAELKAQAHSQGGLSDPGRRTVNDLLDLWLQTASPNLRPKTLENYHIVCNHHIRPALGGIRLSRLLPTHLQQLCAQLQSEGKFRTARLVYAILHRALKMAVLWGWLASNPSERLLPPAHRPERKDIWTPDELSAFLSGAKEHHCWPLWVLLISAGLRVGEALGLAWESVDLEAGTIAIRRTLQRIGGEWGFSSPKTRAGERTISLPQEAIAALKRQRAQQLSWRLMAGPTWEREWGLVFTTARGGPLHGSTVSHALKRECKRLGLTEVSPHGLRHLHASLLLAEGLPVPLVSQRLGHATPAITMAVYAHAIERHDQQAALAIGEVLSRSEGR